MTDENNPTRRSGTDEPDGTPAFAASLRPPAASLTTPPDSGDDLELAAGDGAASVDGRAGYDADAVSGDTSDYRPD